MPALEKLNIKFFPGLRSPLLNMPVALVTVCATESRLVQLMLEPIGAVVLMGL